MSNPYSALVGEVSKLVNSARVANDLPQEVIDTVVMSIKEATTALDRHAWPGPYAVEQLAPPGEGKLVWEPADLRKTVPYSPILGPLNPTAGTSQVWCEDGEVRGTVNLEPVHAGPIGAAHGGIVAALLDELASLAVLAVGGVGYTQSLTVTYRRRTPLQQQLELWAQSAGLSGDVYLTVSEVRHDGKATASAVGVHRASGYRDDAVYPQSE